MNQNQDERGGNLTGRVNWCVEFKNVIKIVIGVESQILDGYKCEIPGLKMRSVQIKTGRTDAMRAISKAIRQQTKLYEQEQGQKSAITWR